MEAEHAGDGTLVKLAQILAHGIVDDRAGDAPASVFSLNNPAPLLEIEELSPHGFARHAGDIGDARGAGRAICRKRVGGFEDETPDKILSEHGKHQDSIEIAAKGLPAINEMLRQELHEGILQLAVAQLHRKPFSIRHLVSRRFHGNSSHYLPTGRALMMPATGPRTQ